MHLRRLLALTLALAPVTALAAPKMRVASSVHFTVYAEQDEPALRAFAADLETYDAVLRRLTGARRDDGDTVPLTVFVRADERALDAGWGVLGYYLPTAAGPFVVVPQKVNGFRMQAVPRIVLFHEYAHHFTLQNDPSLYAPWCIEGLAEFYSTIELGPQTVSVGKPEPLRISTLRQPMRATLERLLSPGDRPLTYQQVDELYARGWLLIHYLTLSPERRGQIDTYLKARSGGASEEEAFRKLGTTVAGMDAELRRYFKTGELAFGTVDRPAIGPVTVRDAREGEAAAIALIPDLRFLQQRDGQATAKTTRAERGITRDLAARLAGKARGIARRFPDDPTAQELLGEAALLAGDLDVARDAAVRTLELEPGSARAHLVLAGVAGAPGDAAAIAAARKEILAANRVAPDDPQPLIANYRSYFDRGVTPPQNAVDGLARAYQLAPQDDRVRVLLAREWIARKLFRQAGDLLRPVAFAPHKGLNRDEAKELLATLPGPAEAPPPTTSVESAS